MELFIRQKYIRDNQFNTQKLTLMKKFLSTAVAVMLAAATYAQTYQIVGAFNGWDAANAVSFEDVEGVLTAEVADLQGGFKIIQDNSWTNQWATNATGIGIVMGEAYTMGGKEGSNEPANLTLANPFAAYKNAKLTLQINGDDMVLTLVSGEFYMDEKNWYLPGADLGWSCEDAQKMSKVEGEENTYTITVPSLSGDFKVVYGNWGVEYGSAKGAGETWSVNTEMTLSTPCDNLVNGTDETYTNVVVTIVVNYETAELKATIATSADETAIESISVEKTKVVKTIVDGKMVIIKDGVKYGLSGCIIK